MLALFNFLENKNSYKKVSFPDIIWGCHDLLLLVPAKAALILQPSKFSKVFFHICMI
jgi:hypothetical protein